MVRFMQGRVEIEWRSGKKVEIVVVCQMNELSCHGYANYLLRIRREAAQIVYFYKVEHQFQSYYGTDVS